MLLITFVSAKQLPASEEGLNSFAGWMGGKYCFDIKEIMGGEEQMRPSVDAIYSWQHTPGEGTSGKEGS